MNNEDFKPFSKLLDAAYELLGKTPAARVISAGSKALFFNAVKHYTLEQVSSALSAHCQEGTFTPVPADIKAQIDKHAAVVWLGVDEAWSLAPKSEMDSAMLTDEIAQAVAVSSPLMEMGDKVAARMAFKDAYLRHVEQAKIAGRQPRYFPSFGEDKAGRVRMLADAVQRGQVSIDRAIEYLPEQATSLLGMCNVKSHPLLAGPSAAGKAAVATLLADLRATK